MLIIMKELSLLFKVEYSPLKLHILPPQPFIVIVISLAHGSASLETRKLCSQFLNKICEHISVSINFLRPFIAEQGFLLLLLIGFIVFMQ